MYNWLWKEINVTIKKTRTKMTSKTKKFVTFMEKDSQKISLMIKILEKSGTIVLLVENIEVEHMVYEI